MAFKMRSGNKTPFKLMGAKDVPMKMMKKSPSKMMKKSPAEFNPGLRKAAADGKLDNNPKFKAAVENAPAKMMKKSAAKLMKKDSAAKLMKKAPAKLMKKSPAKKMDVIEEFNVDKDVKLDPKKYKDTGVVAEGGRKKTVQANRGTGKIAVHKSFEKSIRADIEGKKPKLYQYTGKDKEYVDSDAGKQKYFEMRKRLDKNFRKKTKGFKTKKDYDKSRDEAAKNRESATKMMKKDSASKMMKKSGAKMMKKSGAKMMKKSATKMMKKSAAKLMKPEMKKGKGSMAKMKAKKSPMKLETPMRNPKGNKAPSSKKIGPVISDKMRKDLRNKRTKAEMNLNVSDEQAAKDAAKIQKRIKEERDYIKR
mgnify:CR=1 FL=1